MIDALSPAERVESLVEIAVASNDNAAKQYDDLYRTFVSLDTKAQGVATVGGIVVAAVVAFANAGHLITLFLVVECWSYVLAFSPAALALLAITLSFFAMRIREVTVPFNAKEQIAELRDLEELPLNEWSRERVYNFYCARLRHWSEALDDISDTVERKAVALRNSQIVLGIALASLLCFFWFVLINTGHRIPLGANPS